MAVDNAEAEDWGPEFEMEPIDAKIRKARLAKVEF